MLIILPLYYHICYVDVIGISLCFNYQTDGDISQPRDVSDSKTGFVALREERDRKANTLIFTQVDACGNVF